MGQSFPIQGTSFVYTLYIARRVCYHVRRRGVSNAAKEEHIKPLAIITAALTALLVSVVVVHAEPAMPDSIVRVGACATPGVTWGVFVQGDYAYIADRSALTVVDISNSSDPLVVSTLSHPLTGAVGVFVRDSLAYLHRGGVGIFSVINVSHPDSPFVFGWCGIPLSAQDPKGICLVDTLCYVARGEEGFVTINVAKPDSPTVINIFDTPGYAMDLVIHETTIYVADRDSLQIMNITNPSSPQPIGSCPMPSACYDVSVTDTFAFVVCQSGFGFGSLEVVSVSDPSSPQIVASVDNIVGDPLDVWISGSYAYVAAADYSPIEGGVRIVDISDPLSPSLVASYDTPGNPRGLFAVGDLVFVADYDSLQILRHIATGINESTVEQQPAFLRLRQNQPNPFTDFTTVRYELPTAGSVTLEIYDVTGRLVRTLVDSPQTSGPHTAMWNGRGEANRKLASGVYFYRLTAQGSKRCGKMILLR